MKGISLAGVLIFQVPVIFIPFSFNFWLRPPVMSGLMEFLWETDLGDTEVFKGASESGF